MALHEIKHYEMMYIIPAKYAGEELNSITEKIKNLLTENGAKITAETEMGRRRLAYPIKHVYQGFYFVVEFDVAPSELAKLHRLIQLEKEILRFMIVEKKILSEKELEAQKRLNKLVEEELKAKGVLKEKNEKVEEKEENEEKKEEDSQEGIKKEVDEVKVEEKAEKTEAKIDESEEDKEKEGKKESEETQEEDEKKIELKELNEDNLDEIINDDIQEKL